MTIRRELVDELLKDYQEPQDILGEDGLLHVDIEVPRDRQSTFEPQLVKKGQTRLEGTDRQNSGSPC